MLLGMRRSYRISWRVVLTENIVNAEVNAALHEGIQPSEPHRVYLVASGRSDD